MWGWSVDVSHNSKSNWNTCSNKFRPWSSVNTNLVLDWRNENVRFRPTPVCLHAATNQLTVSHFKINLHFNQLLHLAASNSIHACSSIILLHILTTYTHTHIGLQSTVIIRDSGIMRKILEELCAEFVWKCENYVCDLPNYGCRR